MPSFSLKRVHLATRLCVQEKTTLSVSSLSFRAQPDYMQEASMLMAKLSYVEGDYSEAINQYGKVTLDELALVGAPVYRLSMIAEAYATKGKSVGYQL